MNENRPVKKPKSLVKRSGAAQRQYWNAELQFGPVEALARGIADRG